MNAAATVGLLLFLFSFLGVGAASIAEVFDHRNPNRHNLGNHFFNNNTRNEIKDIVPECEKHFNSG